MTDIRRMTSYAFRHDTSRTRTPQPNPPAPVHLATVTNNVLPSLRDFVPTVQEFSYRHLREHQPIGIDEGTDQMGHAAAIPGMFEAATDGFAVDGDEFAACHSWDGLHPIDEAAFEGIRGEFGKDASEGVMAGDAAGEFQKRGEP